MDFQTQPLNKLHHKQSFDCGYPLLDNYLKKQAKQDVNRDLSACYVWLSDDSTTVVGYYTLSGHSIRRDDFPDQLSGKMPPGYADLPAILLGRLAVDKTMQRKRIGELLLLDALKRCFFLSQEMGIMAVFVDPIDEKASLFYEKYRFIRLSNGKMFIAMKTLKELFQPFLG